MNAEILTLSTFWKCGYLSLSSRRKEDNSKTDSIDSLSLIFSNISLAKNSFNNCGRVFTLLANPRGQGQFFIVFSALHVAMLVHEVLFAILFWRGFFWRPCTGKNIFVWPVNLNICLRQVIHQRFCTFVALAVLLAIDCSLHLQAQYHQNLHFLQ